MANVSARGSRWRSGFETFATAIMVACAIVVAGSVVRRELGSQAKTSSLEPRKTDRWREYNVGGARYGAVSGTVQIVVFSDFECPYCRELAASLDSIVARYPEGVSVTYRHYPLSRIHTAARPAAVAAECAGVEGRFKPFHDALFAAQATLPTTNLVALAEGAGVTADTVAFSRCMVDPTIIARVRADSMAAVKLGVYGTPSLLVNSWLFAGAPTLEQLDELVQREIRAAAK